MGAQIRVLRRRIRSAKALKKITKAQELIATSRIAKAQARVQAARPYAEEFTKVLAALADASALDHPLLVERENARRAGVLVITSDRGLCGGYNANVLRTAEELFGYLRGQDKEPVVYTVGRKGLNFYKFRNREVRKSWTGASEQPTYADAKEIAAELVEQFLTGSPSNDDDILDGINGVDELHIVYTDFKTMLSQVAVAHRVAPLRIEFGEDTGDQVLYEFEPDAHTLFTSLLTKYLARRIYAAMLESAASESAARRRAMKAATDNADDLIKSLTLQANYARQAQITQEISEIVGGVNALAAAGKDD